MKLVTSLTSPYGRKVRIVLAEKRVDCPLTIVSLPEDAEAVSEFNPLGKVPVLIMDDGKPLYDSSVIIDYLDHASPFSRLTPTDHRQMIRARRWEALADGVTDATVLVVAEKRRPAKQQSAEWIARQQSKINRGLAQLSADLTDRRWCLGDAYSVADIAVGCMLGYLDLRMPELDWATAYPNLAELVVRLNERPAFAETVYREAQPVAA
ncbi:glutathione S-transferase N-terminal domain-containing protein [Chitinolyticbacter meiyuanensis]|uniref:glutathione S-transferase N-terminal domain-containing protein n=1 Tax=Chitinolyticbacter meiyuanensis TaxID=682798 RepID=UPI0011E5DD30|nr:glutathione S-transferase N-terminal domain-containing protein [Chitinolyticbacter meiyuanensis]